MRKYVESGLVVFILLLFSSQALAHFGMIIPSRSTIMEKKDAELTLTIAFAHPFAQEGMEMPKPLKFYVHTNDQEADLTQELKSAQFLDKAAWQCNYRMEKPGVYIFSSIPEPYFEPAEDSFIIHYTKTIVGAFGSEDGWERPIGLPIEIVPLTRPFANYSGNTFYGQVLYNGKPMANASVEVENLNAKRLHKAPNAYYETQIVKTDDNGVFAFGIPWPGWWGFAALHDSPEKQPLNGTHKNVEQGGVLWMEFTAPQLAR